MYSNEETVIIRIKSEEAIKSVCVKDGEEWVSENIYFTDDSFELCGLDIRARFDGDFIYNFEYKGEYSGADYTMADVVVRLKDTDLGGLITQMRANDVDYVGEILVEHNFNKNVLPSMKVRFYDGQTRDTEKEELISIHKIPNLDGVSNYNCVINGFCIVRHDL